eukprot:GHUV01027772.1.p1 GENE.GHUV01027772.1~~GHUV01027772.1.p1  ORF type:complete len:306 (-),score=106.27 GHUV01027772.1:157-1074(-)
MMCCSQVGVLSLLQVGPCFSFLVSLMQQLLDEKDANLTPAEAQLKEPYKAAGFVTPPKRRADVNLTQYSWVLSHPLTCAKSAPCQSRQPSDCPSGAEWKHKHLQPGEEPDPAGSRLPTAVEVKDQSHVTPAAKPADAAVEPTQQTPATQQQAEQKQEQEPKKAVEDKQPEKPVADKPVTQPVAAQPDAAGSVDTADSATEADKPVKKAISHQQETPKVDDSGSEPASPGQQRQHDERQDEQRQQGQRRVFISQAMSVGTFICVAGVVGIVVLWRMRSNVAPRARWVRKWGTYAPVNTRSRTVEVV